MKMKMKMMMMIGVWMMTMMISCASPEWMKCGKWKYKDILRSGARECVKWENLERS